MSALRNSLLDPAVNIVIQNLKKELEITKKKMQETQDELSAWKFTPDSVTGTSATMFVYISHSALCLLLKLNMHSSRPENLKVQAKKLVKLNESMS